MHPFPTTVMELLEAGAARYGDAIALRAPGGRTITYRDLAERVGAAAGQLRRLGVDRRDPVLVPATNTPRALVALFAAMAAGTAVPVNPASTVAEWKGLQATTKATHVLLPDRTGAGTIDAAARTVCAEPGIVHLDSLLDGSGGPASPGPAGPDDLAILIATSGSVEAPRLVMLTHAQWLDGARRIVTHFGLGPADRTLNLMPLFHNHGLNGAVLSTILAGGSVLCPGAVDVPWLPRWLEEAAPTWLTGAPLMHRTILDAVESGGLAAGAHRIRFVRSASAALSDDLFRALEDTLDAPVVEIWGLTEAGGQVTANPLALAPHQPGTVGVACHGFTVTVLEPSGAPCEPGASGEIVVRGGTCSSGYFSDPAATAALFRDGWLRTGDVGSLDEEGRLQLRGRMNDVVNRGGEKVWLPAVDTACRSHPAVRDSLAFPVAHARLGNDVAVAVVLVPGAEVEPAELRNYLRGRLPRRLLPSRIEIIAALPTGPTGKAHRGILRELLEPRLTAGGEPERRPARGALHTVIAALWCGVLGRSEIDDDEDFLAAGGDSILATRLVADVSEATGVDLALDLVFTDAHTVASMVTVISERRKVVS